MLIPLDPQVELRQTNYLLRTALLSTGQLKSRHSRLLVF